MERTREAIEPRQAGNLKFGAALRGESPYNLVLLRQAGRIGRFRSRCLYFLCAGRDHVQRVHVGADNSEGEQASAFALLVELQMFGGLSRIKKGIIGEVFLGLLQLW